jgi:arginine repressor
LRWVSRSQRQLVKALADLGFQASQRVVANLLRALN